MSGSGTFIMVSGGSTVLGLISMGYFLLNIRFPAIPGGSRLILIYVECILLLKTNISSNQREKKKKILKGKKGEKLGRCRLQKIPNYFLFNWV